MIVPILADLTGGEIVMIGALALIFFGSKKVPDIMRKLGSALREFKRVTSNVQADMHRALTDVKAELPARPDFNFESLLSPTSPAQTAPSAEPFASSHLPVDAEAKADPGAELAEPDFHAHADDETKPDPSPETAAAFPSPAVTEPVVASNEPARV